MSVTSLPVWFLHILEYKLHGVRTVIEGECSNFCTWVRDQRCREVHFHSTLRVQKKRQRRTENGGLGHEFDNQHSGCVILLVHYSHALGHYGTGHDGAHLTPVDPYVEAS